MRIALIHNPDAGAGVYNTADLVRFFGDAGYDDVQTFGNERLEMDRAIASRPDVLAVFGGDGTVAKVAIALCGSELPLFLLRGGTSNNIAHAIGAEATVPMLVAALAHANPARLDIGRIRAGNHEASFVEGVGVGFIGSMLGEASKPHIRVVRMLRGLLSGAVDRRHRAAHGVARLVRRQPVRDLHIRADGEDLSGEYVAVEVMNIDAIGPRVLLAPHADPGDGKLDLVLVRPSDRAALADYIESRATPAVWPSLLVRRVREVELDWPATDAHVDDELWPPRAAATRRTERVTVNLRGAVNLLVPER